MNIGKVLILVFVSRNASNYFEHNIYKNKKIWIYLGNYHKQVLNFNIDDYLIKESLWGNSSS